MLKANVVTLAVYFGAIRAAPLVRSTSIHVHTVFPRLLFTRIPDFFTCLFRAPSLSLCLSFSHHVFSITRFDILLLARTCGPFAGDVTRSPASLAHGLWICLLLALFLVNSSMLRYPFVSCCHGLHVARCACCMTSAPPSFALPAPRSVIIVMLPHMATAPRFPVGFEALSIISTARVCSLGWQRCANVCVQALLSPRCCLLADSISSPVSRQPARRKL
jgi:hypothetical protein